MGEETGYVVVELEKLVLAYGAAQAPEGDASGDLSVRLDLELINHTDVFAWASSSGSKCSFGEHKALRQPQQEEQEQQEQKQEQEDGVADNEAEAPPPPPTIFFLGFPSLQLKTNYIDLNVQVMSALCNVELAIKIISLAGAGDTILAELSLPLSALLTAPELLGAESSLSWRVCCDNDMTEYCVGSAILQVESAALLAPPAAWGLHYADVIDPKAKVPPSEADLRAKYLENIPKLVEAQGKLAQFTLAIGGTHPPAAADSEGEGERTEGPPELLPQLTLATGHISFDAAAAAALGLDADIRSVSSLWSVRWHESPKIFLTRQQLRLLAAALSSTQTDIMSVSVPVTMSKIVLPEGAAAEGPSLNGCGIMDITALAAPGAVQAQLTTELAGQGFAPAPSLPEAEPSGEAGDSALAAPLGPACSICLVLSRPLTTPRPSLPPTAPRKSANKVAGAAPREQSADVLAELRSEIAAVVRAVALEYVMMYPAGMASGTGSQPNRSEGSPTATLAERKAEFLYYLSTNGAYHTFKESLKPKIQRVVRHLYGPRGQALGRSSLARQLNTGDEESKDDAAVLDKVLAELYVVLVKESNVVMNGMFAATVIARDSLDLEGGAGGAVVDDESETLLQKNQRLLLLADDAEADGRTDAAEAWHLERIVLARTSSASPHTLQHGYDSLARYYMRQAAVARSGAGCATEAAASLLSKAREALEMALSADNSPRQWRTSLLQGALLVEQGQERGSELLLAVLHSQSVSLPSFDDFDGYESEGLCGSESSACVDPVCYAIMAAVFSRAGLLVRARKALRLANVCFLRGQHLPPAHTHGSPKRTLVLLLAKASIFLAEHCLFSLAQGCYSLAAECEAAATAKAHAKNLPAATPPFIRCLMKRALAQLLAAGCEGLGGVASSDDAALEAVLVAVDPLDVIDAQLAVAAAASSRNAAAPAIDALLAAITAATRSQLTTAVPAARYIQATRLLLQAQRLPEAYTVAVTGCRARTSPSMLLQLAVCCLRQDQLPECEDALQEANLLDNRNASVWAYLALLCLSSGSKRLPEAEACLYQSLRLGLNQTPLLRELSTAFMACDKLATAEDLIRRALAAEVAEAASPNPHYRKLLGDVLAGQQQAARAVEEYKAVIADGAGDTELRLLAATNCLALLETLGRSEEAAAVKEILASLRMQR